MTAFLQLVLVLAVFAYILLVVMMIKRERTLLKYSLVWLGLGVLGLAAALFPNWVFSISDLLGFEKPVNLIFFACVMFLMIVSLEYNAIVSKQSVRIKELIQEVSLANERIRKLEDKVNVQDPFSEEIGD